jgi:uncharacterized protein YdhG (YjbR/CyaY superfamily)
MKRVKDVDEYIANAPREVQRKLKELWAIIRKAAPNAEERISYGMPYYGYKGRLVYFSAARKLIGLYVPPPAFADHKNELGAYGPFGKSTVHFPLDEKLPVGLIILQRYFGL